MLDYKFSFSARDFLPTLSA